MNWLQCVISLTTVSTLILVPSESESFPRIRDAWKTKPLLVTWTWILIDTTQYQVEIYKWCSEILIQPLDFFSFHRNIHTHISHNGNKNVIYFIVSVWFYRCRQRLTYHWVRSSKKLRGVISCDFNFK